MCRFCIAREGIESSRDLKAVSKTCSLCEGILLRLDNTIELIKRAIKDYDFKTFLVGASLPQSILDNEDEVRSRLKIKGRENVKTQITRILSKRLASATKKKVDYSRPDLTILISLIDDAVTVMPRSIWIYSKYRKLVRGIPQRSSTCKVCNGLGCAECNYTGKKGTSIQFVATSYFNQIFEAEACNFVWLGSEDEMSLVQGSGRPFFVEVVRPKKRKTPKKGSRNWNLPYKSSEGIEIPDFEILRSKPANIPQFKITAKIHLKKTGDSRESAIDAEQIQKNFSETNVNVRLSRKSRTVQRRIHSLNVLVEEGGASATLTIDCDGGIPLKKFVSGQDGTVEPNISSLISSYELDKTAPFDIADVQIKEVFGKKKGGSQYIESERVDPMALGEPNELENVIA